MSVPHGLPQNTCNPTEHFVAGSVPVAVIEFLEMIDVRKDKGKGPPLALENGVILRNFVIERPAVRDASQRVDPRFGVLRLDHPRLFLELHLRGGELLLHLSVALDELCHRVDHRFRPRCLRGRQFVIDLLHPVAVLADVQGHGRGYRI